MDSGFPFEKTDNLGHRRFRGNRHPPVDLIRQEVACFDPAFLLLSPRPNHLPQMLVQLLGECLATARRDEDDVILAVPLGRA